MLINENILVNLILKPFGSMEVVHKSISLLVSVCVCVCINKYMHMCVCYYIYVIVLHTIWMQVIAQT